MQSLYLHKPDGSIIVMKGDEKKEDEFIHPVTSRFLACSTNAKLTRNNRYSQE